MKITGFAPKQILGSFFTKIDEANEIDKKTDAKAAEVIN